MFTKKTVWISGVSIAVVASGLALLNAQSEDEITVNHAECQFFGPEQDKASMLGLAAEKRKRFSFSDLTERVVKQLSYEPNAKLAAAASSVKDLSNSNTIDRNIYGVLQAKNITPAAKTSDAEFVRRVTLDLTGRIPTVERLTAFLSDTAPDKRQALVEELLASPAYVDKWTMYFGDLLKNAETISTIGLQRYPNGRQAFYDWIKASISANKPYNKMAAELIGAGGENSFEKGELNWLLAGRVTGGPAQDVYDQMAMNVADTFLGMSQMNCIMCHSGRGHLTGLSLWGEQAIRADAYQMASFYSQTNLVSTRVSATPLYSYWSIRDVNRTDYQLNTTTGNRPARTPLPGNVRVVAPVYPFSGKGPQRGENYRTALAREVTGDFQFARATVNYIFKQFFVRALVEPVNQFDPMRLDPDNPPPDPWTLQPSNARLLKELSQEFIDSGYDLKALMRQIVNSDAYQMSARYDGAWKAEYEPLYARKLVRRMWSEEIHDAVALSSNVVPTYSVNIDAGDRTKVIQVRYAMQLPSPNLPGGTASTFLNTFLRGNRDDADRRTDGSDIQALALMNDTFVMSRTKATTGSLLAKAGNYTDDQLVATLYLTVLSRMPSDVEKASALAALKSGNRSRAAEDLLWSLFNKVDFFFNY